jgi:hypothetical protein
MIDETTMAIITGAVGNMIANVMKGRTDALREWASRTFRSSKDSQGREEQTVMALVADSSALTNGSASESDIRMRWTALLAAWISTHPEALQEIAAMASYDTHVQHMTVGSQHNHGTGVFIGGNNYGGVNRGLGPEDR